MTLVASLFFLAALTVTAYALYISVVPALPHIADLMEGEIGRDAKPRLIYYGIDRRTARQMEEQKLLIALKPRAIVPELRQRQTPLRHAA